MADRITPKDWSLIHWALGIAISWEENAIDCQTDSLTGKSMPDYANFNQESLQRIEHCRQVRRKLRNRVKRSH